MKTPRVPTPIVWLWKHTAAVVALLLIALAFVIGLRLGDPGESPNAMPAHAHEGAAETNDAKVQMYTCSMHPSVRLPDPDAKCPICFMDLIPVREGDAGDTSTLVLSEGETAAARVETTPVVRYAPTSTLRLFGKVRMDETTVERISAYFPGRIETLYANFNGARVNAGDHLAQMYSPELLAGFGELRQAAISAEQASTMSDIVRESSLETLQAARDRLRLFGIEQSLIEQIEQRGYDEDTFTIDAPRGGTITQIASREGEYVQTGQPILTIADLTHLWVDLQAYESQIDQIRWGQPVRFSVESHPGELFEGRVSFIDPMIDPQTRSAAVRLAVENPQRTLKPGMFASATISVTLDGSGGVSASELIGRWVCPMHPTEVHDAPGSCGICGMDLVPVESLIETTGTVQDAQAPLVVPASAVLFTGTRSVVYTQTDDENGLRYTPVEVTLGQRAGDVYIGRDGLSENDRVVTKGAFRIDSAMQIAGKPSMMSMESETEDDTPTAASRPAGFMRTLADSVDAYLYAQEALADDNLRGFNAHAEQLNEAIEGAQTAGLGPDDLGVWRRAVQSLRVDGPDESIKDARAGFELMSGAIVTLIDHFGQPTGSPLYVAHCPMAFDFKGADWLQRTETIDNPYFGASMLLCGEIRREVEPMHREGD